MSRPGLSAARTRRSVEIELGQAFEREVLAVERHQHRVGGDERVEGQEAERRRTVDEDVVIAFRDGPEQAAQPLLAREQSDHLDFRARQVAVGGDDFEPLDGGGQDEATRGRRRGRAR